ncbi:hypothetical protein OTK49_26690 [Vibrio coralliirubri]|uniref:hypothetical protein n=1 Tax=Vibrio coralliirubri TaxID=1516159 RepID=UPI0022835B68|nr:hypothetical protein [Vibrio coralliirubri]MCY9866129.1 hypothetical protein [Vibrio coralliirubri]
MLTYKKGGYLLLEAMLASAILSAAILYRSQIELRYKEIDEVKELAADVVKVPYAIDKRVLLDGHTLSLSKTNFTGAQDTVQNMLVESLIGDSSAACLGGWSPVESANNVLNLIPCNLFNYAKMPFGMNMDGSYNLNSNDSIQSYLIELYHDTEAEFLENAHVYPRLVNYARVMDEPQMTGTHKYFLRHRTSKAELTPNECRQAKEMCSFVAEYSTNFTGLGEDVYLRVNGGNFMRGDIRFVEQGSAPMKCRKVNDSGVSSEADCGIDFTDNPVGVNDINIYSKGVYGEEFILANSTHVNGSTLLSASCKSVTASDSSSNAACGLTVVKKSASELITRAALHEISSAGSIYTHDGNRRTFEVDASTGNVETVGKATIKNSLAVEKGVTALNGNVKLHSGTGLAGSRGLEINASEILFKGDIPMLESTNTFGKRTSGNLADVKQMANELVTKGYMHSFHQIIDIKTNAASGAEHRLFQCPNGKYANAIGFPAESSLLMSQAQIDRVCPYTLGKRIPDIKVELSLAYVTPTQLTGSTVLHYKVGCRWEGDYAQAWFMNVNQSAGKYVPRFYLVSPRTHDGKVGNIEVAMRFTVIQYCEQGGLKTR